jgi:hypothetical protein
MIVSAWRGSWYLETYVWILIALVNAWAQQLLPHGVLTCGKEMDDGLE